MSLSSIAEQSAAVRAGFADQAPAAIVDAFAAEQRELTAAGIPSSVATAGTQVPDGDLLDVHGAPTSLTATLAGRPGVVVFYRGAWCPYCNLTLRTYQAELVTPLADKGATLVAISPQKPDGSLTMQETNELSFAVLSDPGNQIAGRLGILTRATPEAAVAQRALGLDVTTVNADGTGDLPMPTTLVVDAAGTIRWIDVHPDYTTRSEVTEILAALESLT